MENNFWFFGNSSSNEEIAIEYASITPESDLYAPYSLVLFSFAIDWLSEMSQIEFNSRAIIKSKVCALCPMKFIESAHASKFCAFGIFLL